MSQAKVPQSGNSTLPLVLLFAGQFEVRGSCSYSIRLLEHLPRYGFRAEMICTCAERVPIPKRRSLPIHEYPYLDLPVVRHLVLRQIAAEYRDHVPALLHIQQPRIVASGVRLASLLNIPSVTTVHDFLAPSEKFRVTPGSRAAVIAVSEAVQDGLAEHSRISRNQIHLIRSGVDVPDLATRPNHSVPVVGTAGPLELVKGHHFFLEAARRVLDMGYEVEFVIAGSGREESNLRQLTRTLKLADRVTFAPFVRDYGEVLEAVDVFVLPSLQQGLGTVMLEAMALGRPVIASRVGGVHSILKHEINGLMIEEANPAEMARSIQYLLDHPDAAERMGQVGRDLVAREFSVDQMTNKTAEFMRDFIAR